LRIIYEYLLISEEMIRPMKGQQTKKTMKKIVVSILVLIFTSSQIFGQQKTGDASKQSTDSNIQSIERNKIDNTPVSITFSQNSVYKIGSADQLFRNYVGIDGNALQFVLAKSTTTKQKTTVEQYDEYYNGVKIVHGVFTIMYNREGKVTFMNGNSYTITNKNPTKVSISEREALNSALAVVNAETYAWQVEGFENRIKEVQKDKNATHYPKGELVWIEDFTLPQQDRTLHLAYKFNIYAIKPLSREYIYIDATNGKILDRNSLIHNTDGTGASLYSGTVSFKTAILSGINKLHDTTRGNGINTYTCANGDGSVTYEVTSASTTWASDAALDAHWGAEKVYDYWLNEQGRNSYDNAGATINSYVHFLTGYNNAFWDGYEMVYGDGSGLPGGFSPLTALDVCAHEIGHAVCENTAGLAYNKESGAMNEGLSDIWGAVIENYADPHETDAVAKNMWKIGEEIGTNPLRRMDNPNTRNQPDTYGGTYWVNVVGCTPSSGNDYCGVHTNSGVLNYWFYLMCTGGSGTNDLSNAYSVTGIGVSDGADIAYQTELALSSTATFANCRTASIAAASTLFGSCSPQVEAVTRAWYAVGVGANYSGTSVAAITGTTSVCVGNSTTLANATSGGTWTSVSTGIATIGSSTGTVTGVSAGTSLISYVVSGGCFATKIVTVQTLSAGTISGTLTNCIGGSSTLSSSITGGIWTSGTPSVASIGSTSGILTGATLGNTNITYSISSACGTVTTSVVATVSASPSITGTASTCVGGTTALSSAVTGGTWSSSNLLVATIGSTSGIATGILPGTATITYYVGSGCTATLVLTVNSSSPIFATDIPLTGILGWYPFNGNANNESGTTLRNGRVVNATLATDRFGNSNRAYDFNGTSSRIAIDTNFFDVGWNNYTIACWLNSPTGVNPYNANNNQLPFNTVPHHGFGVGCNWGFSNKFSLWMSPNPAGSSWSILYNAKTNANMPINTWTHIAVVKTDANHYNFYINGSLDTTFYSSTTATSYYTKMMFGHIDTAIATNEAFLGRLDDYGMWNRSLNSDEVLKLYAGSTNTISLCVGSTATASISDAGGTWSSSNVAIATIGSSTGIVSGISAGTCTISYVLPSGCYSTRDVSVTTSATAGTLSGTTAMCAGASTSFSSTVSGGIWTSSNTGVANVGSSSGIVSAVAAGVANITYTITSACGIATATTSITINALPSAITGTTVVNVGATTTLSSATGSGTWTSGNTTIATVGSTDGIVTGVSGGSAIISYTTTGGCTVTTIVTVTSSSAPITGTLTVCEGLTTTLSISLTGGSWSSSSPGIATIGSTGTVTGISTGTSIISYAVTGGSVSTATVTVLATPASISGALSMCPGFTSTLSCTPGSGTWSSSNVGVATIGSTSGVVTGIVIGTANITYTLSSGCSSTVQVTVGASSPISGPSNVCIGASITLGYPIGGGTWLSSNTAIATIDLSTGLLSGLAFGMTTVTYTLAAGCFQTKNVYVQNPSLPLSGSYVACVGNSATISCSNPGGAWTSSDTTIAIINAVSGIYTGISAGTATLTYTLVSCYNTHEVTINAVPATITGNATTCAANTTTLSCATSGGTWTSSNTAIATIGSSTGIVTGVATGTTRISYTLPSGCASTIVVTVGTMPAAITGSLTLCNGSSTTLSSTTSGGSWSSSNAAIATTGTAIYPSTTVTGVGTGNATISYTTSGCSRTAVVTVNTAPAANSGSTSVCVGSTTTFTNSTSGGTWSSSSPGYAAIGTSTGIITALSTGTSTISYMTSATCYSTTDVTVNSTPSAIGGSTGVCIGSTTTLTHTTTGGTWASSNSTVATIDVTTGVVSGIAAGAATITYTVSAGCFKTTVINVYGPPAAITGTTVICEGSTTTLYNTTYGGTWTSSDAGIAFIGYTSGALTGASGGTATITYSVSSTGCFVTKDVTINGLPAAISGSTPLCVGATSTFASATSGGTWTSSSASVASVGSATGLVAGITGGGAIISYTLSTGCRATYTLTVSNPPSSISGTMMLCAGNTTTLTSSTAGQTWSSSNTAVATVGSATSTTGLVTGTGAGTATISYTNANGCARTAVVTVSAAIAASTGDNVVCVGQTVALSNATSGGTWASSTTAKATVGYYTGVVNGIAVGTANITYRVPSGCVSITQVTVNAAPAAITGTTSVCVGQTITLSHETTGGTWSTTSATASVDAGGIVTGISPGYAYITYSLSSGCTRTTTVLVRALPHVITGPTSVATGAYALLSNATSGGVWSSGTTAIATMPYSSLGYVLGVSAGTANITYRIASTGCFVTYSVDVYSTAARPDNPTDDRSSVFAVFPNPTSGALTINAEVSGLFSIYTIDGRQIQQNTISAGTNRIQLPAGLATGFYMCRFEGIDGSSKMVRLVLEQ
jgi:trimeric autotransporter adhesin